MTDLQVFVINKWKTKYYNFYGIDTHLNNWWRLNESICPKAKWFRFNKYWKIEWKINWQRRRKDWLSYVGRVLSHGTGKFAFMRSNAFNFCEEKFDSKFSEMTWWLDCIPFKTKTTFQTFLIPIGFHSNILFLFEVKKNFQEWLKEPLISHGGIWNKIEILYFLMMIFRNRIKNKKIKTFSRLNKNKRKRTIDVKRTQKQNNNNKRMPESKRMFPRKYLKRIEWVEKHREMINMLRKRDKESDRLEKCVSNLVIIRQIVWKMNQCIVQINTHTTAYKHPFIL